MFCRFTTIIILLIISISSSSSPFVLSQQQQQAPEVTVPCGTFKNFYNPQAEINIDFGPIICPFLQIGPNVTAKSVKLTSDYAFVAEVRLINITLWNGFIDLQPYFFEAPDNSVPVTKIRKPSLWIDGITMKNPENFVAAANLARPYIRFAAETLDLNQTSILEIIKPALPAALQNYQPQLPFFDRSNEFYMKLLNFTLLKGRMTNVTIQNIVAVENLNVNRGIAQLPYYLVIQNVFTDSLYFLNNNINFVGAIVFIPRNTVMNQFVLSNNNLTVDDRKCTSCFYPLPQGSPNMGGRPVKGFYVYGLNQDSIHGANGVLDPFVTGYYRASLVWENENATKNGISQSDFTPTATVENNFIKIVQAVPGRVDAMGFDMANFLGAKNSFLHYRGNFLDIDQTDPRLSVPDKWYILSQPCQIRSIYNVNKLVFENNNIKFVRMLGGNVNAVEFKEFVNTNSLYIQNNTFYSEVNDLRTYNLQAPLISTPCGDATSILMQYSDGISLIFIAFNNITVKLTKNAPKYILPDLTNGAAGDTMKDGGSPLTITSGLRIYGMTNIGAFDVQNNTMSLFIKASTDFVVFQSGLYMFDDRRCENITLIRFNNNVVKSLPGSIVSQSQGLCFATLLNVSRIETRNNIFDYSPAAFQMITYDYMSVLPLLGLVADGVFTGIIDSGAKLMLSSLARSATQFITLMILGEQYPKTSLIVDNCTLIPPAEFVPSQTSQELMQKMQAVISLVSLAEDTAYYWSKYTSQRATNLNELDIRVTNNNVFLAKSTAADSTTTITRETSFSVALIINQLLLPGTIPAVSNPPPPFVVQAIKSITMDNNVFNSTVSTGVSSFAFQNGIAIRVLESMSIRNNVVLLRLAPSLSLLSPSMSIKQILGTTVNQGVPAASWISASLPGSALLLLNELGDNAFPSAADSSVVSGNKIEWYNMAGTFQMMHCTRFISPPAALTSAQCVTGAISFTNNELSFHRMETAPVTAVSSSSSTSDVNKLPIYLFFMTAPQRLNFDLLFSRNTFYLSTAKSSSFALLAFNTSSTDTNSVATLTVKITDNIFETGVGIDKVVFAQLPVTQSKSFLTSNILFQNNTIKSGARLTASYIELKRTTVKTASSTSLSSANSKIEFYANSLHLTTPFTKQAHTDPLREFTVGVDSAVPNSMESNLYFDIDARKNPKCNEIVFHRNDERSVINPNFNLLSSYSSSVSSPMIIDSSPLCTRYTRSETERPSQTKSSEITETAAPLLVPPTQISEQLKKVTDAVQGTQMVASALAAAVVPTLGFAVARQQALTNWLQNMRGDGDCSGVDPDDGVPVADSPTQISIGSSDARLFVGGAVGNFALSAGLVFLGMLGGTYFMRNIRRSASWDRPFAVFARCNVAMVLFVCLSLLFAPTVKFALVVAAHSGIPLGEKLLAIVCGLLLFVVPGVYYIVWSLFIRERKESYRKLPAFKASNNDQQGGGCRNSLDALFNYWFEGPGEWRMPLPNTSHGRSVTEADNLAFDAATPMLDGYQGNAFWFGAFEFAVQLGLSLAAFLAQLVPGSQSCVAEAIVLLIVLVAFLFMCIYFRPFQERFNRVAFPITTIVEIVIIAIALIYREDTPEWIDALVMLSSSMQSFMALLILVVSLGPLAKQIFKVVRRYRNQKRRNERNNNNSSPRRNEESFFSNIMSNPASLRSIFNDDDRELELLPSTSSRGRESRNSSSPKQRDLVASPTRSRRGQRNEAVVQRRQNISSKIDDTSTVPKRSTSRPLTSSKNREDNNNLSSSRNSSRQPIANATVTPRRKKRAIQQDEI